MDYNYKNRKEVPDKYKWDLSNIYASDKEWYHDYELVERSLCDLSSYNGKLFENNNLFDFLELYYRIEEQLRRLFQFASLKVDEDLGVQNNAKMYNQASTLYSKFEQETAFLMPELLHHEKFDVTNLLLSNPSLKKYKHFLEEIEAAKVGIKSESVEKIISLLNKDLNKAEKVAATLLYSEIDYGKIKNEKGEIIKLNNSTYNQLILSNNRSVRRRAYYTMNKNRVKFASTLADNLLNFMSRRAAMAKIRGFDSTKEMDFAYEKIPLEVHQALKDNVVRGLPLFQRYFKVYKKILGLKKMYVYDTSAPITDNNRKYSVEEAQEYVLQATKVLGPEYTAKIKQAYDEKWIDYISYNGKTAGAYCQSIYGNNSRLLLNFVGNYGNVSCMAHELGHAINSEYRFANNEFNNADFNLYTAEIPSLLNEILLSEYIINGNFSREEKIAAIVRTLEIINGNFFTAIMENEWEEKVYQKLDADEVLSVDDLNGIMKDLLIKYYGKTVEMPIYVPYMWSRRSHYFSPWYLYKYATCLCGALYFANGIINDNSAILDDYFKYLKMGDTKFPNDILLDFNIDLTNKNLYDNLFEYYNKLLNKLSELCED